MKWEWWGVGKETSEREAPIYCFHCLGSEAGMRAENRGGRAREKEETLRIHINALDTECKDELQVSI